MSLLWMCKNPPVKLSKDVSMAVIRRFGDFMQEMGERGIPITEFQHSDEREAAAARRLGLPKHVISWLASLKRK